jgi:hypothetical protein
MDYIPKKITKIIKDAVITNQNNKCAKKPYSRINGLEGYSCVSWKRKNDRGTLYKGEIYFIKKNKNKKPTEDNLLALCEKCYHKFRKKFEDTILKKHNSKQKFVEFNGEVVSYKNKLDLAKKLAKFGMRNSQANRFAGQMLKGKSKNFVINDIGELEIFDLNRKEENGEKEDNIEESNEESNEKSNEKSDRESNEETNEETNEKSNEESNEEIRDIDQVIINRTDMKNEDSSMEEFEKIMKEKTQIKKTPIKKITNIGTTVKDTVFASEKITNTQQTTNVPEKKPINIIPYIDSDESEYNQNITHDYRENIMTGLLNLINGVNFNKQIQLNTKQNEFTAKKNIKYRIIYYTKNIIPLKKEPYLNSETVGHAYFGDVFDGSTEIDNNVGWICICYNNMMAFVKTQINDIPVIEELKSKKKESSIDSPLTKNNECSICMENIDERIVIIPCGHTSFCSKCIEGIKNNKCPICRYKIDKINKIFI